MPLFMAFIVALMAVIQLSVTQMALHVVVRETTKQVAAHMYPVELLYKHIQSTSVGQTITQVVDMVKQTREKTMQAEQLVDNYAFFIPEPMIEFVKWEQAHRVQLEQGTQQTLQEMANLVFQPLFRLYASRLLEGQGKLDTDMLKVKKVTLPRIGNKDHAYFGVIAEYTFKLPVPFFQKEITLQDQAYERVWIGH